jgi:hypothetical protein
LPQGACEKERQVDRVRAEVLLDDDVPLSARKGKVIVRSGKGETSREIPLLDAGVEQQPADGSVAGEGAFDGAQVARFC